MNQERVPLNVRKRVGFVALRFFEERTGNIESLLNLMRGVNEQEWEPSLLVPYMGEQAPLFDGLRVHPYAGAKTSPLNLFAIEQRAVAACVERAAELDLFQVQLPSPAFVRVAERIRRATGKPVVASFESGYHRSPAVPWPRPGKTLASLFLRRAVNARLHARLSRFAIDACVVASEYQRVELRSVGCGAPTHVIANATVCSRFEAPQQDAAAETVDSLVAGEGPLIAYIGHFNFIKGVPYLLDAFERLKRQRPDARLLVVGSGRGNESRLVREGVARLGPSAKLVERTVDVAALLHRLDVLALPYVASYGHQLYPNLVLEGLAAGVPVVSSDLPPVNEIIREGETGYLAKAGDAVSLAAALERALLAGRSALASAQRSLCRAQFDYRVVARRHLDVYQGVLS